MLNHYLFHIRALEAAVTAVLKTQCMDQNSQHYGTVEQLDRGYSGAHGAIGIARQLIEGYYTSGCRYCGQQQLLARAIAAIEFSLRLQNEDGTFDLLETNYHDASETAFIVGNIGPAILLMKKRKRNTPLEVTLYEYLLLLINRSSDGILNGGFHTPNHRWVHSAALSLCYELTGRSECLHKMNLLLCEGIDCDEEGEYTERSSGVYNIICDRALIILAQTRGMTSLYGHVTRNLRMIFKYFEPDLTINTLNSTRQDVGTSPDWRIYYSLYLYMAMATDDREFRYVADRMLEQSISRISAAEICATYPPIPYFEFMPFWQMDESLTCSWTKEETEKPRLDYEKHFVKSGVVRFRHDDFTMTLLEKHPTFAMMQCGKHTAYFRMAGTFFAQGQFSPEKIERTDEGFLLTYRRRWGYKGPLPERPDTSDWSKMKHELRPDVMMQDFVFCLLVVPQPRGAIFKVRTEGVENVLTKFEIMLEPGALFCTEAMEMYTRDGDYIYQKCSKSSYRYMDHMTLHIEGGCWSQSYGKQMRGSLNADGHSFTLAMTGKTPLNQTFVLRFE